MTNDEDGQTEYLGQAEPLVKNPPGQKLGSNDIEELIQTIDTGAALPELGKTPPEEIERFEERLNKTAMHTHHDVTPTMVRSVERFVKDELDRRLAKTEPKNEIEMVSTVTDNLSEIMHYLSIAPGSPAKISGNFHDEIKVSVWSHPLGSERDSYHFTYNWVESGISIESAYRVAWHFDHGFSRLSAW